VRLVEVGADPDRKAALLESAARERANAEVLERQLG
jgi:hypothetical protein